MVQVAQFWWILSALSVLFLLVDWSHAPIDTTMHVGFVLIAAFMGPVGAVLYILTVREPLPGTHAQYIAPLWKQVVGSTFHCVAGDSVGIVGAAVITRLIRVPMVVDLVIEYAAGFLVGWLIFQSLFMKDMVGGSYGKAVRAMFMPEWLSMNGVMAGMAAVMVIGMMTDPRTATPGHAPFWFLMSMALIAGAVVAYPINWWLVSHKLKHGIMSQAKGHPMAHDMAGPPVGQPPASRGARPHIVHPMPQHQMSATTRLARPYRSPVVWISLGLLLAALALAVWV